MAKYNTKEEAIKGFNEYLDGNPDEDLSDWETPNKSASVNFCEQDRDGYAHCFKEWLLNLIEEKGMLRSVDDAAMWHIDVDKKKAHEAFIDEVTEEILEAVGSCLLLFDKKTREVMEEKIQRILTERMGG